MIFSNERMLQGIRHAHPLCWAFLYQAADEVYSLGREVFWVFERRGVHLDYYYSYVFYLVKGLLPAYVVERSAT